MCRVPHEDDGVERLERGEARGYVRDERGGGAWVEGHDGESAEGAGGKEEGVEGGGGVAGVERHGDALDGAAAHEGGGDAGRGEDGAEVA